MTNSTTLTIQGTNVAIERHGIQLIDGALNFEQWRAYLDGYRQVNNAYIEGLADLIRYGRSNFGDNETEDALKQLEFSLADAQHAASIGQTTFEFRDEFGLSSEHYYLLGKLPDDDTRRHWAGLAKKHDLTALELKRSIEGGKVIKTDEISQRSGRDSGGLMTVQALVFSFERWEKQVGGEAKVLSWDRDRRQQWLQEMNPMLTLADRVRQSLDATA